MVGGFHGGSEQTDSDRDSLTWFQAPLINSSSDEATALIKSAPLYLNDRALALCLYFTAPTQATSSQSSSCLSGRNSVSPRTHACFVPASIYNLSAVEFLHSLTHPFIHSLTLSLPSLRTAGLFSSHRWSLVIHPFIRIVHSSAHWLPRVSSPNKLRTWPRGQKYKIHGSPVMADSAPAYEQNLRPSFPPSSSLASSLGKVLCQGQFLSHLEAKPGAGSFLFFSSSLLNAPVHASCAVETDAVQCLPK